MTSTSSQFDSKEESLKTNNFFLMSSHVSYQSLNDVVDMSGIETEPKTGDYLFNNKVQIVNAISTGGQATVYLGYDIEENKFVAVKYYIKSMQSEDQIKQIKQIENEFKINQSISHKNVIEFLGVEQKINGDCVQFYILMEFIEQNLYDYIETYKIEKKTQHLPIKIVKLITGNILEGLSYLHQHSVIHFDLKPLNILISKDLSVIKITDFGISKSLENTQTLKNRSNGGTIEYMSPEMFSGKPYGYDADIWAVGCIVYQMVSGRAPYKSKQKQLQFIKDNRLCVSSPLEVADDDVLDIFYDKSNRALLEFVQKCWRGNNVFRPTVEDLLKLDFIHTD